MPAPVDQRIEQFDGLRAVAFLGVFVFHALAVPYTWMGVDLFFVLSGYLITRNLVSLRERDRPRAALRVFYYRRVLRIVPAYYAALLLTMLVQPFPLSEAPWYLAFASNIRDTLLPPLKGQLLTMWSIAVEEQFYLVWPFLVLFLPRRQLRTAFIAAIALAPLARLAFTPFSADAVYRLTVSRMDLLGLGALVAWLEINDATILRRRARWFAAVLAGATASFIALAALDPAFELEHNSVLYNTVGYSLEAAAFTCVLVLVRTLESGPLHAALCHPVARYLGRISYMAYLTHVLALDIARRLSLRGAPTVALALGLTVAIASASWYLLEAPLHRLRGRVEIRR